MNNEWYPNAFEKKRRKVSRRQEQKVLGSKKMYNIKMVEKAKTGMEEGEEMCVSQVLPKVQWD